MISKFDLIDELEFKFNKQSDLKPFLSFYLIILRDLSVCN